MAQNLVQLDDHLYQAISHNPEAAGSSPASATKKPLKLNGFKGFSFVFGKAGKLEF